LWARRKAAQSILVNWLPWTPFKESIRDFVLVDLLDERGIEISHETLRFCWNRVGPMFAAEIRCKRVERMRALPHWRWHLDEVCVKINGVTHYLWRTIDHEGKVMEDYVSKTRGRKAPP
jgi:putative transposase